VDGLTGQILAVWRGGVWTDPALASLGSAVGQARG
jgi:hypothetical protein